MKPPAAFLALLLLAGTGRSAEPEADALPPLAPVVVGQPERIEVYPPSFTISRAGERLQLVVTGVYADGGIQDLTRAATLESDDAQVVSGKDGVLLPGKDGRARVTVTAGGKQATVAVEVSRQREPAPVSFLHDAIPALTKQGCNGGGCHGSPSGKGGFSLSMLGYDPQTDLLSLTRADRNRRTNVFEPEQSLLIRKPTMQVAHGGGERLRKTDAAYAALTHWIGEGCLADPADAPRLKKVMVYPETARVLRRPAHTQQLCVLAAFADGSVRDVTPLATYTTSEDPIARVTPDGLVVGRARGTAAVTVRFLDAVISRHFTFVETVPGFEWNDPKANNYVDEKIHDQLHLLQYLPAAVCSDEEFVRRVHLDVIGLLPSLEETRRFLADPAADKRARLIDALLDRPEFAKFWGHRTADLLRVNSKRLTEEGARKYNDWIVDGVAKNRPYDEFVRELLTASGDTYENPPANYYRAAEDTPTVTETTAQLFMGVRIGCAKCHNHPFERWTQDNYYGIAAVFHRVQRHGDNPPKGKKQPTTKGAMTIEVANSGEMIQPRTGREMRPWLPLEGEAAIEPDQDRRAVFARWLTRPDNPFFARVAVNRLWAYLMGRGIVEPVDDFRESNPPANAALLDALAKDFVEHGFDRKHVLRVILNSRTYQQKAEKAPGNPEDGKYFSSARVRLLTAEQLLDAVGAVTGVPEKFGNLPEGTLATQLPTPMRSGFLAAFGQPERESACQCERSSEATLEQALQMLNGGTVQRKVQASGNRLHRLLKDKKSDAEILEELYLTALCRKPRPVEVERATRYLEGREDRVKALEDLLWAVLNTREFLFQH
jgi:hypothetical protein